MSGILKAGEGRASGLIKAASAGDAVSWQTDDIKTGDFTADKGEGYFVNTTSAEIDVTLPASPSAGDLVGIRDYAKTFDSNTCFLLRNGSKIDGIEGDMRLTTEGQSIILIFVDSTRGWMAIEDSTTVNTPQFVAATGGTVTTSGNFKIHTFTSNGCFQVTNDGNSAGSNTVDFLVVAGGGGGGGEESGGGGAGGYRESPGAASGCYSVSPVAGGSALSAPISTFPIVIGAGGSAGSTTARGGNGNNSSFSTITSTAGGGGGTTHSPLPGNGGRDGQPGGSGGGSGTTPSCVGSGNTPPVSPAQGNNGGQGGPASGGFVGGGGGGATAVGSNAPNSSTAGAGGAGGTSCITASPVARGGGGGAGGGGSMSHPLYPGGRPYTPGSGGTGGGGSGAIDSNNGAGGGSANTGGGGGGGNGIAFAGGPGGSGVVIIRYKFQ